MLLHTHNEQKNRCTYNRCCMMNVAVMQRRFLFAAQVFVDDTQPILAAHWGVLPENVLATAATPLSFACHCEPVRTLVWQSASPQGNLANWRYFRQIRSTSRIRPKYCFPPCPTAGEADCHVAPLLAMTCRRLARVRACKDALPGKPVTAYVFAQGAACFLLPLRGSGLSRRFAPRNDSGGGPCTR